MPSTSPESRAGQLSGWAADVGRLPLVLGALLLIVGYLPLTLLGPGTDLDVGGVHDAGRAILAGDYQVSRAPGAPVFETAVGVLHELGGPMLVNLGSVAMAGLSAVGLARLVAREGHPHAGWLGVALLLNPYVWIAGTSMVDFLWAAAFLLAGANLQRERRWAPAAVLYALAAGCRLSTLALVAAFLLADLLTADRADRRRIVATGAAAGALTVAVFLPPLLTHGAEVLRSEVPTSSVLVQVGRWGVKNWFFFGPAVIALVAVLAPRLARALAGTWSTSLVLRMGVLGAVAAELVYLRFPWKLGHLVPALVCLLLVLGASRLLTARTLGVLLAAQVLLGVVNLDLAEPDRPGEASGGTFAPEVVEGQWVRDLRCRVDGDRDAYRDPDRGDEGGTGVGRELLDTWRCVVPWSEETPGG